MKEKPRIARLTAILTLLQSKRILTARAIAEKFDVSIRTVYRDIRTLEKSGVPIVTEEGIGYSLMEGFNLPPVMFTESEANALITAEKLISQNADDSFSKEYGSAINKIKSILRFSQKEKVELLSDRIAFFGNYKKKRTSDYLMSIQNAIADSNTIQLTYYSLSDQKSSRVVEPFALYSTENNWLMVAFCRLRKDFRVFRLDRIEALIIENQHFEPRSMTLLEYFEKARKKYLRAQETPDIPLS